MMNTNDAKHSGGGSGILECSARLRFVLVEPTHPGNIGATARAMKTMGLTRLAVVQSCCFPDNHATAMAVGAADVLEQATRPDSLADAVADYHLVIGTSARARHLRWPIISPSAAAEKICGLSVNLRAAIVFGRESAGLSNAELDLCQYLVHIPCNPNFNSLNLASAVQVIAYEIYCCATSLASAKTVLVDAMDLPAPLTEVERFFAHLQNALQGSGFLKNRQPVSLMRRLRRLFHRAHLTQREVNILHGMISAFEEKN